MTLKHFKQLCKDGWLLDCDGIGYYATDTEYDRDKPIYPSDVEKGKVDKSYKYVLWFNK
jgi:hypothetical protein